MKKRLWHELGEHLLGFIYPRLCVLCGMRVAPFEACVCTECALEMAHYSELHYRAQERLYGSPLIQSLSSPFAYQHENSAHRLIIALKYYGAREVASFIVHTAIREGVLNFTSEDIDLILPVPISKKRREERGFNQATLLARHLSTHLQKPVDERYLLRRGRSTSQTKLSREERRENAQHAFYLTPNEALRRQLAGKRILLVDDVLTTGSTLLTLCDLLESCGVREVHVFVASVAVRP